MKIINIQQDTEEWHEFRRWKIGASDTAAIMGDNPWGKTPYKLWKEKMEDIRTLTTATMQKGKDLEPIARMRFIETTGINMEPAVLQDEENEWQIASLDGINKENSMILEIKCGGKDLYDMACEGKIPIYYQWQLQKQIKIAKPRVAFYAVYFEGNLKILEVEANESMINDLNAKEAEFKALLDNKEPPPLSDHDYEVIENGRGSELLKEYFAIIAEEKRIEARKKMIKEEIIEVGPGRNFILNGTKIYQTQNSSYDFKLMKEQGIPLENYKKLNNSYWMISSPRGSKRIGE